MTIREDTATVAEARATGPVADGSGNVMSPIARGVVWNLLGSALMRGLTGVSSILVARILGPQAFGEFSMVQSTVLMLAVYASFRLGITCVKYVSELRTTAWGRALRILRLTSWGALILCGLVSGICYLSREFLATRVLGRPALESTLGIGSLFMFLSTFGGVLQTSLAAFKDFKAIATINILRGVLTLAACVPLALLWGVNGAMCGLVLVAGLAFPQILRRLKSHCGGESLFRGVGLADVRAELPVFLNYTLPHLVTLVVLNGSTWLGRVIVARQSDGYFQLGLFGAADQWRTIILFIPATLPIVILPFLTQAYSAKSSKDFKVAFSMQFKITCLITLPLTALVINFGNVLALAYGKRFPDTGALISLLMVSVMLSGFNQAVRTVYDSSGKVWTGLCVQVAWGLIYLTSAALLVPSLGAKGFVITHIVAESGLFILQSTIMEVWIVRGALSTHWRLLTLCGMLIGGSYANSLLHRGVWASAIGIGICCLASAPLIAEGRKMGLWSQARKTFARLTGSRRTQILGK